MQIEIIDPDPQVDISLFRTSIEQVFLGEQKQGNVVNVIFMKRDELRSLKKEYFDLDVDTDVIAFNLNDPELPVEGEICLSLEQIKENALGYKTDLQSELLRVLIHACLHLCGYEDDTKALKAIMTSRENHYLAKIRPPVL